MVYEYAQLLIYYPLNRGVLCVYHSSIPLKEYTADAGYPYLLQQVSAEGWQIVGVERHEPHADNDYSILVHLQRRKLKP